MGSFYKFTQPIGCKSYVVGIWATL